MTLRSGLALVLSLCLATGVVAETRKTGTGSGYGTGTGSGTTTLPPVDHTGSANARKELNTAETEFTKAKTTLNGMAAQLRKEFDNSAEMKAALEALKAAQAEFEAVRRPLLAECAKKPEYQAAKAAKEKADADKEAVMANTSATPEERLAAANSALQAGSVLSKMEADTLAADANYTASKAKLIEANAKVQAMIKEFEAGLKNNGQYTAAQSAVDSAKQKVDAARKSLADAVARESEAEKARAAQMSKSSSTGGTSGTTGVRRGG